MIIERCYIESFGCFKDKTFDFSKGVNIIYGENEKGKSTIAAFIRFVLYGFSKKAERDRYFPLDISFASGSVDIDTGKRKITLSRNCKGAKENVKAIDALTGNVIDELCVKNAGEILTGATRSAFEKTLFTPQKQMEITKDEDINSKLRSLVNTGSDDINLEKVRKKLDDIRAKYYYVKENGGPLYELKKERDALYYELEKSQALYKNYERFLKEYKELSNRKKALLKEIEKENELFQKQSKFRNFKKLSEIKKKNEQLESISQKLSDAEKEITFNEKELCYDDILNMQKNYEKLADLKSAIEKEQEECKNLSERKETLEKTKEEISNLSEDIEYIETETQKANDKNKKSKILGISLIILGIISLALCLITPYFSFVGAVIITLGIVFTLKKNKIESEQIFEKYQVDSLKGLSEKKAMLSGNLEAFQYIEKDIQSHFQKLNELTELLNTIKDGINSDLKNFSKDESYDYFLLISELKNKLSEKEDLKKQKSMIFENYKFISQDFDVSKIDEEEFEKWNSSFEKEEFSEIDETALNQKRNSLSFLSEKIFEKKNELDNVYSGKKLPSQILEKISEIENQIEYMEKNYKSVKLSIEVLEKAEDEIKNTFAPMLNQKASGLINKLSLGKYEKMMINEKYDVTLYSHGKEYSESYLSTGMVDMVFFAIREAISSLVFSEEMPMFFDDSFVYMDDERLKEVGSFIGIQGKTRQIFIFTCQKRELKIINSDNILMIE